ncbi:hypothetical protein [Paracnuella aquatica]|uniref:hypothetical protein n=1 Tax=Paracnuella aquatica TaxID=2268757 RepID=UPI000DEF4C93|nr:hypothetical protein [Paracnuella aquatica]RPD45530.1 hypothetical protein DRJ53_15095 [Paracnuella aquatica]
MKQDLKRLLYTVRPQRLPRNLVLTTGYVFHTEEVYNDDIFRRLFDFCKGYTAITGKQAICTVMSGISPKVRAGMRLFNCSEQKLADLYHQLSSVATIGYHGHFYFNADLHQRHEAEIRSNNFSIVQLTEQFSNDLEWFKKHELNHNDLYAGGWWFMNQHLLSLLIKAGFKYDFSFSKHRFFLNQFSLDFMIEHEIKTGECFEIEVETIGKIREVQNLIGSSSSAFFEDYVRNLKRIIHPAHPKVVGMFNSHDYDLHPANALNFFTTLKQLPQVSFFDAADLLDGRLNIDFRPTVLPVHRLQNDMLASVR